MCGRYSIATEEENIEIREIINEVNERFKEDAFKVKTGEISPTDMVPIIASAGCGQKAVNLCKWGFPNFKQASGVIINSRSETLAEKPTFRKILHSHRCLVPSSGFYEWKAMEGKKEKYLIRTSNQNFFYMAGLYNSFIDKNGNPFTGFVIITTEANEQMSYLHNRMPLILDGLAADSWLFEEALDLGSNSTILAPYRNSLEFLKVS